MAAMAERHVIKFNTIQCKTHENDVMSLGNK